jgi:hypothetical protein
MYMSNFFLDTEEFTKSSTPKEQVFKSQRRPLKTITILITMHGGELIDIPLTPELTRVNTIISLTTKKGCYAFGSFTQNEFTTNQSIESYRDVYRKLPEEGQVNKGNEEIIKSFIFSNRQRKFIYPQDSTLPRGPYEPIPSASRNILLDPLKKIEDIKKQQPDAFETDAEALAAYTSPADDYDNETTQIDWITDLNPYLRQFGTEKTWSPDENKMFDGMYIISTHHIEKTDPLYRLNQWSSANYPRFSVLNKNLTICKNYEKFVTDFNITNRELKNLSNRKMDVTQKDKTKVTSYQNILLSTIIKLFLELGFEHVNIIDFSCKSIYSSKYPQLTNRITDPGPSTLIDEPIPSRQRPPRLIAQTSFEEKDSAADWVEENWRTGGKRHKQKTKKKYNCKSKKQKQKTKSKKTKK